MALDEQLLGRSQVKADNSESSASSSAYQPESSSDRVAAFNASRQMSKNGGALESSGDFGADKKAASRFQKSKDKVKKVVAAALAPAKKGLNTLLQSAWKSLISSFGLTLLWIDAHFFFNLVFGDQLFCNLGEEWIPDKPGIPGAGKK